MFTNGHEELLRGRGYETHGGRALSKGAFGSLRACVRVSDGEVVAVDAKVRVHAVERLDRRRVGRVERDLVPVRGAGGD